MTAIQTNNSLALACALIGLIAFDPRNVVAAIGANVPENQASNLIYVALTGSDSNSGTSNAPLRTIQAALNMAVDKRESLPKMGSKIIVSAGTYREADTLTLSGGGLPIVLEAMTNGTVIVSGSDLFTNGWTLVAGAANVYQHSWTNNWGVTPDATDGQIPNAISRRREMVFVNGNLPQQLTTFALMTNTPGSYFVDDTNQLLYVNHYPGVVASNATYDVAERPLLLDLELSGSASNIVVRGITFQHASSIEEDTHYGQAVYVNGGVNLLFDSCCFNWNNWIGFDLATENNVTVTNCAADCNGVMGTAGFEVLNTLYDGLETCYNNWRGNWGGFYNWSIAGTKVVFAHNLIFQNYSSVGNIERGLWFDTDISNVTVSASWLYDNFQYGLDLEDGQGPNTISNVVIARTTSTDIGMATGQSEQITVTNSVLYANGTAGQWVVSAADTVRQAVDWQTGQTNNLLGKNCKLWDSFLSGTNSSQRGLDATSSTNFVNTLTSDQNDWYNPVTSQVFQDNGVNYTLPGWQTLTGKDAHSTTNNWLVNSADIQDAELDAASQGTSNSATASTLTNGTGYGTPVLLKFGLPDLSTLPRMMELQLAAFQSSGTQVWFHVYRLTTDWDENATLSQSKPNSNQSWANGSFSAADYDPNPVGIGMAGYGPLSIPYGTGMNTFVEITKAVQSWAAGAPNYGLVILLDPVWDTPVADGSNYKSFTIRTREYGTASLRPQLMFVSSNPSGLASFTASPITGAAPLAVSFSDTSTGGAITNRHWDFGDGNTLETTATNVMHTYATGSYTVSLVVSGPGGVSTNTMVNYINVISVFQAWQLQYFACTNNGAICAQAAPDADPYGKGISNFNQFLLGLNPTNPASVFRILSVVPQSNDAVITWATGGGPTNVVQATGGDINGGYGTNFTDISGMIAIPGSGDTTNTYRDLGGATNSPSRYYRIRLGE